MLTMQTKNQASKKNHIEEEKYHINMKLRSVEKPS